MAAVFSRVDWSPGLVIEGAAFTTIGNGTLVPVALSWSVTVTVEVYVWATSVTVPVRTPLPSIVMVVGPLFNAYVQGEFRHDTTSATVTAAPTVVEMPFTGADTVGRPNGGSSAVFSSVAVTYWHCVAGQRAPDPALVPVLA